LAVSEIKKAHLKRMHFESVEAVKTKSTEVFKGIARKGFPTLFQPMENTDGTMYIEGDKLLTKSF